MADIKKILIFSGITLAVVGGGIFTYKIIDDKKKAKEKADRDAKIAALKATINSGSSTPQEVASAKNDIGELLAAPLLGIGSKLLDGLIGKIFPDKTKKDTTTDPKKPTPDPKKPTPNPKPTPPDGGGEY